MSSLKLARKRTSTWPALACLSMSAPSAGERNAAAMQASLSSGATFP
eukprot:CAMPEP_0181410816 /NCGR_PEP_ID=MMETSP1110-20121109/7538_1 /TAXON_ID=174948 /ORGANISM="Symbiodinium sp., Strain CCMP421" /LENGTH=46 /DNA_ID= /DNA_START= /DNA_END= /DNA_ORIENTATION=